jgi:hypothetical protein
LIARIDRGSAGCFFDTGIAYLAVVRIRRQKAIVEATRLLADDRTDGVDGLVREGGTETHAVGKHGGVRGGAGNAVLVVVEPV